MLLSRIKIFYIMKTLIVISLFSLFLVSGNAFANDTKMAIIDVKDVESGSKKVQNFRKEIEKKQSKYQDEIKKLEEKIQKDANSLKEKSSTLSSEQLKKEEAKLKKDIDNYSAKAQKYNAVMEFVKGYGVQDLNKCLWDSVSSYAKQEKIDLVMPASSVMYVSSNVLNITNETVKSLDSSSCKIDAASYFKKAESDAEKIK
jgi:outer membrane protein